MSVSLGPIFERFVQDRPIAVMARAAMERAIADSTLDALFERTAKQQYTRELLFSSCVHLMTLVVCNIQPAIHAAYQEVADTLPVSIASVYNKLNGIEPEVSAALVHHTASVFGDVIPSMGGQMPDLLPGYRARIVDGNHLAATERRLDVLRQSHAGPLPGQCLVVLEPALMLATKAIPCEDGHAQERSLTEPLLDSVEAKDVWIADRNFCTTRLLFGIAEREAFYVIRQHGTAAPWQAVGPRKRRGRIDSGVVYEQDIVLTQEGSEPRRVRRITVELDKATRDGDREIHLVTNLPKAEVNAKRIAEVYQKRWTLEVLFQELTVTLNCEINTLGYPKAALFGFCVALMAYNVVSVVKAALRAEHGHEQIEQGVSGYFLANEVSRTHDGMMVAVPPPKWKVFRTMTAADFGRELRRIARGANLRAYKKHPRGPKKPVPKRIRYRNKKHVSTARLLAQAAGKAP
jgi:IS4 transposase